MKRLSLFLLFSSLAFGQGVILPTQQALKVVNGITSPVANATITVCAANANGIPCTPVLPSALFKDAALTQPLSNPFTSDANGNYVFAIAPGNYTVTVSAATFIGYSYQTTAPVAAGANNTFTGNTTFTGPVNLNGGGSMNGAFSVNGPMSFFPPSTFTNTTMSQGLRTTIGSCSTQTEFQAGQTGSNFATESDTACVAVPSGSTVFQAQGYFGAVNSSSTATNTVGGYFSARSLVANAHIWGINPIVISTTGFPNNQMYGIESDVNVNNTGDLGIGVLVNGAWSATPTGQLNGFHLAQPLGGTFHWTNGLWLAVGATTTPASSGAGVYFNPIASGTNQQSQGMEFAANDPASGQNFASMNLSASGQLTVANSHANAGLVAPQLTSGTIGNALAGDVSAGRDLWVNSNSNAYDFHPANPAAQRTVSIPDPGVNVNLAFDLTATSAAFATATTAGTCVQNTTAVTGAATTMAVVVSPVSTPGVGAVWSAFVSSSGNVTINECAVATSAGGTIAFNIRVIP